MGTEGVSQSGPVQGCSGGTRQGRAAALCQDTGPSPQGCVGVSLAVPHYPHLSSGLGQVLGPEVGTAGGEQAAAGRKRGPASTGTTASLLAQTHSRLWFYRKGPMERLSRALAQTEDPAPSLSAVTVV